MEFWTIVQILGRRKWVLLTFVLIVVVGTAAVVTTLPTMYEATARVMPSQAAVTGPIFAAGERQTRAPQVTRSPTSCSSP
jgi:uncharacterized protein involved in exopolysaccharide biosynthesis